MKSTAVTVSILDLVDGFLEYNKLLSFLFVEQAGSHRVYVGRGGPGRLICAFDAVDTVLSIVKLYFGKGWLLENGLL